MKLKIIISTFLAILIFTFIANSTTVQLINGDRITGEITNINSNSISIHSEILGSITIPLDKVDTITSEHQYKIITEDGTEYVGKINYKNGVFSISKHAGKKAQKIEIASLKKIEREIKEESSSKEKNWTGEVKALASFQRGTVDTSNFEGNIKFERQSQKGKLSTEIWGNYGEVEGDINTRQYGGELRYTHYPKEKLYLYTETSAERDEGRKLGLRYQIGAGAGYDLLKKEKQSLSLESALLFTYEEYLPFIPYEKDKEKEKRINDGINRITTSIAQISQNPKNIPAYGGVISGISILIDPLKGYEKTNDDFVSLRIGSNFSRKILSSTLTNELSLNTNLERLEYYRFSSTTNISTPLHENLSLEVSLSNDYDSDYKNKNIDAWEHRLSTGIKYEFR